MFVSWQRLQVLQSVLAHIFILITSHEPFIVSTKRLNGPKSGKTVLIGLHNHKWHSLRVGFPDNIKLNQGHDPVSAPVRLESVVLHVKGRH